jgi:catechol 2,3-dioxygenase-like lactoylglutathione lyase family enzyme
VRGIATASGTRASAVGEDVCEGSLKPIIERWKSLGIPITAGPSPRTGALGRMTSIYCEDPDGNLVEVATYSADP